MPIIDPSDHTHHSKLHRSLPQLHTHHKQVKATRGRRLQSRLPKVHTLTSKSHRVNRRFRHAAPPRGPLPPKKPERLGQSYKHFPQRSPLRRRKRRYPFRNRSSRPLTAGERRRTARARLRNLEAQGTRRDKRRLRGHRQTPQHKRDKFRHKIRRIINRAF